MLKSSALQSALARAQGYLFNAPVVEAVLARREAGEAEPDDDELCIELAQEVTNHQSSDGSWGSQVTRTAEAMLLLGKLLRTRSHDAAELALRWLHERQNLPGRFGDPCEPDLHEAGVCHHALGGFLSPAAPQVSLAGATLGNGVRLETDRDARAAASALALRAWLRWAPLTPEMRLLLSGLVRLADRSFRPERTLLGGAASLEILATLAAAPRSPDVMVSLHGALSRAVSLQRGDGSFSGMDMFHALEVLLSAISAGYSSPAFDAALSRSAEMLTFMQQENGSWGRDVDPHRTLIAWRTLRIASQRTGVPGED